MLIHRAVSVIVMLASAAPCSAVHRQVQTPGAKVQGRAGPGRVEQGRAVISWQGSHLTHQAGEEGREEEEGRVQSTDADTEVHASVDSWRRHVLSSIIPSSTQ